MTETGFTLSLKELTDVVRRYDHMRLFYETGAPAVRSDGVWHCPACAARVRPGWAHCKKCGKKVEWT